VEACGSLWKRILIESIHVEHVIQAEMKFAGLKDYFEAWRQLVRKVQVLVPSLQSRASAI